MQTVGIKVGFICKSYQVKSGVGMELNLLQYFSGPADTWPEIQGARSRAPKQTQADILHLSKSHSHPRRGAVNCNYPVD